MTSTANISMANSPFIGVSTPTNSVQILNSWGNAAKTSITTPNAEPEAILFSALAHARIMEVPVQMRERQGGTSSINLVRSMYYSKNQHNHSKRQPKQRIF